MKRSLMIFLTLAVLFSCKQETSHEPERLKVPERNAAGDLLLGQINGENWYYKTGHAFISRDESTGKKFVQAIFTADPKMKENLQITYDMNSLDVVSVNYSAPRMTNQNFSKVFGYSYNENNALDRNDMSVSGNLSFNQDKTRVSGNLNAQMILRFAAEDVKDIRDKTVFIDNVKFEDIQCGDFSDSVTR